MSETYTQVMIATYQDESTADSVLDKLTSDNKEGLLEIQDAAVIRKDEDGKLHIKETADPTVTTGAGVGALIGGVVGLLGGPVGVVILGATGAAVGGLAASYDAGIKDESLEEIGEKLQPDSSALVVVVEQVWLDEVKTRLNEDALEIFTTILSPDFADQFIEGEGVTITKFEEDSNE